MLVYGREYFFGAGIKFLPEGEFAQSHGLLPVQVLPMGETQVDSDMFHEYLHSISPRFSPGTYDILNNNCNNFSNECTHFLTGNKSPLSRRAFSATAHRVCVFPTGCGIPTHIIDLPRLAMATPAGALLRPMIEGLQNGVRSDGSSTPLSAFGTNFTPPAAAAAPVAKAVSVAASAPPPCKCPRSALIDPATYAPTEAIIRDPIKSQDKDSGLLGKILEKFRNGKHRDGSGRTMLDATELRLMEQTLDALRAKPAEGSVAFPEAVYALLMKTIAENPAAQCAYFYVLQLMMLYESNIGSCYLLQLMQNVSALLDPQKPLPYEMNGPARFLAVCSLSNYFSRIPKHKSCPSILVPMLNVLLDICTLYISSSYADRAERPELRQWTASLLHNILLFQQGAGGWTPPEGSDDVHPHVVQILCGVIEEIADEKDIVVLHRRLVIAFTILAHYPATRQLFKDLGFADTYRDLKERRASSLTVLSPAVDQTLQFL